MGRELSILIHAGFVLTGIVTTLLGPILPLLAARWSLQDAQAGSLFTAQFVGSMTGVGLSGVLHPRYGPRLSLVVGLALMSVGVGALDFGDWTTGLCSVFVYGIGLGLVIPTTNLLVAEANPAGSAAALNILNLAWGVGAVTCPVLAALFERRGGSHAFLPALAVALAVMAALVALVPRARWGEPRRPERSVSPSVHPARSRLALVFGALFFLYVGTENAVGGWVASYARRLSSAPGTAWLLAPSLFWAALLLGRGVAPAVLRRLDEERLVLGGLVLATLGVGTLLTATRIEGVLTGVGIAGFGLGPVFPTVIALMSRAFGAGASRVAGMFFALAGLGGATLPWLVGVASTHFGGLKAGLVVALLGSVTMIGVHSWGRRHPTDDPAPA